jgi:hypothetical protein
MKTTDLLAPRDARKGVVAHRALRLVRHGVAHRGLLAAAGLAIALAASACARPYTPATPDGFIDLGDRYDDRPAHEYRASTADGVVLGIRAFDNDPKADMALAVKALENRVRLGQGYALLDEKDVTARDGTKGKMMRFGHDEPSGPHLYYVTIFLNDKHVFILEAGGKKDLVEKAETSIDWAIKNFLPK